MSDLKLLNNIKFNINKDNKSKNYFKLKKLIDLVSFNNKELKLTYYLFINLLLNLLFLYLSLLLKFNNNFYTFNK